MKKKIKKVVATSATALMLMSSTSVFAAPGYYVGSQKFLSSDIMTSPSLLLQLNQLMNTSGGINSLVLDLDSQGTANYGAFRAAFPNGGLPEFTQFAGQHAAQIPAGAVVVKPDGTTIPDPDIQVPSTAVQVQSVSAQNGKVSVVLTGAPATDPDAADFQVTQKIDEGSATAVTPTNPQWNASTKTVSFDIPPVAAAAAQQNVVITVSYLITPAVSAPAFLVEAEEPPVAPELSDINVTSATGRSNTEVTVVLSNAPLQNLDKTQFSVSGLTISNVTTNDNVVTLETSPQTVGRTYTVTFRPSGSSKTFTGVASVVTGAVKKVDVPNLRQIRVDFNQPVLWSSAKADNNYYINLLSDTDGDLAEHSLDKIGGRNWHVSAGDQDIYDENGKIDPNATVNYVFIESCNGAKITDRTPYGLGLEYDKRFNLQVRNVKGMNGYFSTSQGQEIVDDVCPPSVVDVTSTVLDDDNKLEITFDEPVLGYLDVQTLRDLFKDDWQQHRFEIYIDNIQVDPLKCFDAITHITDKDVDAHRTVFIDLSKLNWVAKGENHTLKVFGASDLAHNVNVGSQNPYVTQFFYDIKPAVEAPKPTKAQVVDVKQIADNQLEITFDQVVEAYNKEGRFVTIKQALWTGTEWQDLIFYANDSTHFDWEEVKADDDTSYSKLVITYDANLDKNHKIGDNYGEFNFNNQISPTRDVVVENYVSSYALDYFENDADALAYVGDTYTENYKFVHDTAAPVGDKEGGYEQFTQQGRTVPGNKLYVAFEDAPFDGIINLQLMDQLGRGIITVSRTDTNGKNASYDIDKNHLANTVAVLDHDVEIGDKVFRAGRAIEITVADPLLDTENERLYDDSVYTVHFAPQTVIDANQAGEEKVTPEVTGTFNEITATDARIAIPKTGDIVTDEGRVPQTSKGLIYSGHDIWDMFGSNNFISIDVASAAGATLVVGDRETPGTREYMIDDANRDKIMVVFDGEVLESSALNKNNYRVNGEVLGQDARIEFHVADEVNQFLADNGQIINRSMRDCQNPVVGPTENDIGENIAFVLIDLPQDTIDKDGLYEVEVKNITNKSGKEMLPVKANVALSDNTLPTAENVKVGGSNQLTVTFDEEIEIRDAEKACNNFDVDVDGTKYTVTSVDLVATGENKAYGKQVILTLDMNIEENGSAVETAKATVNVQDDEDGNMWIFDYNSFSDMLVNDQQNEARETEVTNF